SPGRPGGYRFRRRRVTGGESMDGRRALPVPRPRPPVGSHHRRRPAGARGPVELPACDAPRGALLLERLDASRSLAAIPVAEAAAAAGTLIRTLAITPSGSFPSLRAQARQLAVTIPARQRALQDPLPGPWITQAARLAVGLARDTARLLVHTDLHYENVLTSRRPGQ